MSTKPLHVRFLLSRIITSSLLLGSFMQFALLVSKICLAYFIDFFSLIPVHGNTDVPFLILPLFPYTRQSVVGRAPFHDFILVYIVLSTMLGFVLHCGVFFSYFCHILHFISLWFKYFCCVIFGLPHLDMCCYHFIFSFWVQISLIITRTIIIIIYHFNIWYLQLCTWKSQRS